MDKGHLEDLKNHFNDGYEVGTMDGAYAAYTLVWMLIDSGVATSLTDLARRIESLTKEMKEQIDRADELV